MELISKVALAVFATLGTWVATSYLCDQVNDRRRRKRALEEDPDLLWKEEAARRRDLELGAEWRTAQETATK